MLRIAGKLTRPGLLAGVVGLIGCGGQSTSDADIAIIEIDALVRTMNHHDGVLLDVRAPHRYQRAHLPGSINIPYAELRPNDPRLRRAGTIMVYDGGWSESLARVASKRLIEQGYADVRTFPGGVEQWRDSGREVVDAGGAADGGDGAPPRPDTSDSTAGGG